MDALSDLLRRSRTSDADVRQLIQHPPWAMTFDRTPPLTLFAALGGRAVLRLDDRPDVEPCDLAPGDIAVVTGSSRHTVSDDLATASRVVIRAGRKHFLGAPSDHAELARLLAPRTYGAGGPGATTLVRGTYAPQGDAGRRLLSALPPVARVPANPRTGAALDLLTAEAALDEPGQDAVLHRLLDLILVLALREGCARLGLERPTWYHALSDPAIGAALEQVHTDPAHRWTVAELAAAAGMSRAAFAARFAELVGQPPLTYLTDWRMTVAADLLRDGSATTVAAAARAVGYQDAFAFSVAFKRVKGVSPSRWSREPEAAGPPVLSDR
ncbi:AraC family transcriptional regulator [Catenulispora yoronensis]|uniref:AraC family transcriptional regulator n=1 Tax=Catenulispora yoronensis TaxID=450799 RepID=A0ABN2TYE3_9ACTN